MRIEVRIKTSEEGQIVNDVRKDIDSQLSAASKSKSRAERRQIYTDVKQLRQEVSHTRESESLRQCNLHFFS